jgi:hypothetical protein
MFKLPFGNLRRPFSSLKSDKAKRIRIANDVLMQLNKRAFEATNQIYLSIPYAWERDASECQLQEKLLGAVVEPCKACALGGMFLSMAKLNDHITVAEASAADRFEITKNLGQWFTQEQLSMIETAFECNSSQEFGTCYGEERTRARNFSRRFLDSHTRLGKIMQNIIKNDGEFKP